MRPLRTHHVVDPANVLREDLLREKEQRTQRLALRGGRNPAVHGQMPQELLHLLPAHCAGMPCVMKEDAAFRPPHVGFFGA
jgi:hypothetical protein